MGCNCKNKTKKVVQPKVTKTTKTNVDKTKSIRRIIRRTNQ